MLDLDTLDQRLLHLPGIGILPSRSEERGISLLRPEDHLVFSPGISTAGLAEYRMLLSEPSRRVIATSIDRVGLDVVAENAVRLGLQDRLEVKYEDLAGEWKYPQEYFDFIFARLVLHYLDGPALDRCLVRLRQALKPGKSLFAVIKTTQNIASLSAQSTFDPATKLTRFPILDAEGKVKYWRERYLHTEQTMTMHLREAGFEIVSVAEYPERLCSDFFRLEPRARDDYVLEIVAR